MYLRASDDKLVVLSVVSHSATVELAANGVQLDLQSDGVGEGKDSVQSEEGTTSLLCVMSAVYTASLVEIIRTVEFFTCRNASPVEGGVKGSEYS